MRTGEIAGGNGSGASCPCIISYPELLNYATGSAVARMSTEAQGLISWIHKQMKSDTLRKWKTDPTYLCYFEKMAFHGNYRGYLQTAGSDLPPKLQGTWHFVRRLADDEVQQLREFRLTNGLEADWNSFWSKFETAVWNGVKKAPSRGAGDLAGMVTMENLAIFVGSIAVMFGPQGVILGGARLTLQIVGLGVQAVQWAIAFGEFGSKVNSARRPQELDEAANILADVLGQIAIAGLTFILLKGVEKWKAAADEAKMKVSAAEAKGVTVGAMGMKFPTEGVTEVQHYSATKLLDGEFSTYRRWSHDELEVVREPSAARAEHLEDGVWGAAKNEQLKTKSLKDITKDGKTITLPAAVRPLEGLVGTRPGDFLEGGLDLAKGRNFDMGHIGAKFKGLGVRKAYPLKPGTVVKDIPTRATDYLYVDLGEGWTLIVDKGLGTPVIPDIDMMATAPYEGSGVGKPGPSKNWTKGVPDKLRGTSISDDASVEIQRNRQMNKATGNAGGIYEAAQHSGKGGAAAYVDAQGHPKWNPIDKVTGKPPNERLIMFIKGRVYIFDTWYSYKHWTVMNNCPSLCPWDF